MKALLSINFKEDMQTLKDQLVSKWMYASQLLCSLNYAEVPPVL